MKLFSLQNILSPVSHALLASPLQGFGCAALLFSLCFLGVHIAKIAVRGWRLYDGTQNPTKADPTEKTAAAKTPSKPSPEAKLQPTAPEPIYYIVEKKRRRSKASYGEPKEIRFK